MTTTDTKVNQLVINRLTKTQFNGASPSSTEIYAVDPEFVGGKLLKTNSDGDIVETNETIPTDTNDLTNGAGFITGITSGDVTTALGYTPYDASNPSGYQENVIETIKVNGTAQTVTSKAVDITVPTNNNQLTNGAGYITGITSSDVTTALGYTPYNSSNPNGYTSNVGTVTSVNNTSPDGSGNVSISVGDTLPSQSGQNGKFLTTDGSSTSWASVGGSSLPSQTGHSGEFLTTDGTDASWAAVDALPSQTGQSGKFLTTDGTDASWASVTVPVKDNLSITENSSNQLQTVGVIDQRDTTTALKQWSGTKVQYDAIVSKDSDTIYNVKDEPNTFQSLLETIYPVGSIYIGTMAICPMSALFGTWTLVGTKILTDIPATLEAKGNGKSLGLDYISGGNIVTGGLGNISVSGNQALRGCTSDVGKNVGTYSGGVNSVTSDTVVGVTTDSTKSGIVADTNATSLTVNLWQRVS